ncbi:MAG: acetylglutamate kinase [Bacteroidales bacterium]|nr:acetylglutamate kinase [Bacteroidales bacterium]
MSQLTILKIGGNIIDVPYLLEKFISDFVKIEGPKILIHGGGKLASELSAKMGIETKMHEGRRITDYETLKLVTMVYAGLINKEIVAGFQKDGCNAIGLSGADANIIPATRRAPQPIDFGYVGDVNPQMINDRFLFSLLSMGITPVICAITHDGNGSLLNTNADTIASSIAIAMSKHYSTKLVYCFEKNGVLLDPDDDDSVISLITYDHFQNLKKEGIISKGMIPKLDNAFKAISNGVSEVEIKHASNLNLQIGTLLK